MFDQSSPQVLQAAVVDLEPAKLYVLALRRSRTTVRQIVDPAVQARHDEAGTWL